MLLVIFIKCDNATEPKESKGSISGTVNNLMLGDVATVHPAYIFLEDSLIATTDELGKYSITLIEKGSYFLTCSALNYRDTTEQVHVIAGKTETHDFYLTPDFSSYIPRIYIITKTEELLQMNGVLDICELIDLTQLPGKRLESIINLTLQKYEGFFDLIRRKFYTKRGAMTTLKQIIRVLLNT